jgi:hypothetical protein
MQPFASRDLMVSALPETSMGLEGDCGNCTNCTACTDTGTSTTQAKKDTAKNKDLSALQEQLRATR